MPETPKDIVPKAPLDQFGTFEVFVQPKEGKPFQHEGIVHAPELEMAYVLAKEAFTRRFTCTSLYVVDTRSVFVSPLAEGTTNAYDLLEQKQEQHSISEDTFEIYHLLKRGKQHVHIGTVKASTPDAAMQQAKTMFNTSTPVMNIWAIRTKDIRFTEESEKDLWGTLPEKKFRDAASYKGGDKLKTFLERNSQAL
ncbi:phenylacetic acid degradation b [Pseudochryseolinea flava]|uniref:Phenylacetic acid degradation b n=1 Tax=Pseudochryseolinea flava TaxID=2059302 RepID=A0A364XWK4_9BACT|nr:phenylacetic acid degradation b [Pseudochryseolinea flava]